MCKDKDLFGDVIVTLDDVELWLDMIPKHLSHLSSARLRYALDYDIASKIKAAKLNGYFYTLQELQDFLIPTIYSVSTLYGAQDFDSAEKQQQHKLAHLIG